jgi:CRP-like cAMP-binding protein/predicted GNAT family N-acyltransferase
VSVEAAPTIADPLSGSATQELVLDIQVRDATTVEEREAIYRLRYEVYVEELGEFRDVADHARRMLRDPGDETARHLYAKVFDQVVGALRYHLGQDGPFSPEEEAIYDLPRFRSVASDRQMATLSRFNAIKDFRSTLVPFELLLRSIPFTPDKEIELLFCDCQPHLLNLYTRLGFRSYTRIYNDPVASILVPLVLFRGDVEHFRRIGSPLQFYSPGPESVDLASRLRALIRDGSIRRMDGGAEQWDAVYRTLRELPGDRESLFHGLTEDEVHAILSSSFLLDVRNGDRVIRRGQVTRTVFFVVNGRLEVREGDRTVATLERGDVFGEVAFLTGQRISDVYAIEDGVRIVGMSEKALWQLIESHTREAALFLLNLSTALARKLVERSYAMAGPPSSASYPPPASPRSPSQIPPPDTWGRRGPRR